jgi:hypothetical protein
VCGASDTKCRACECAFFGSDSFVSPPPTTRGRRESKRIVLGMKRTSLYNHDGLQSVPSPRAAARLLSRNVLTHAISPRRAPEAPACEGRKRKATRGEEGEEWEERRGEQRNTAFRRRCAARSTHRFGARALRFLLRVQCVHPLVAPRWATHPSPRRCW